MKKSSFYLFYHSIFSVNFGAEYGIGGQPSIHGDVYSFFSFWKCSLERNQPMSCLGETLHSTAIPSWHCRNEFWTLQTNLFFTAVSESASLLLSAWCWFWSWDLGAVKSFPLIGCQWVKLQNSYSRLERGSLRLEEQPEVNVFMVSSLSIHTIASGEVKKNSK